MCPCGLYWAPSLVCVITSLTQALTPCCGLSPTLPVVKPSLLFLGFNILQSVTLSPKCSCPFHSSWGLAVMPGLHPVPASSSHWALISASGPLVQPAPTLDSSWLWHLLLTSGFPGLCLPCCRCLLAWLYLLVFEVSWRKRGLIFLKIKVKLNKQYS